MVVDNEGSDVRGFVVRTSMNQIIYLLSPSFLSSGRSRLFGPCTMYGIKEELLSVVCDPLDSFFGSSFL